MSKTVFKTDYQIGQFYQQAKITKKSKDLFVLKVWDTKNPTIKRSMSKAEYDDLSSLLYDEFPQAEFDFGSINRILAYGLTGDYHAEKDEIEYQIIQRERRKEFC